MMGSTHVLYIKRSLLFLLLLKGSLCLRDVYMNIPEAVERGKSFAIKCLYDLEKDDLYQVKWYRGDREFCRYAPRDVPPFRVFPISGIEVDREASNAKQVMIKGATQRAEGRYTCEVSADAPSFITAQMHGSIFVVDLPKEKLEMHGLQDRYKPGMTLRVECISRDSMPPANLTFYVNKEPAHPQHLWHRVAGGHNGTLWTSFLTIQFVIQKHHFIRARIKIKCAADIYSIYYWADERVALEVKIPTTPRPEPPYIYGLHPTKAKPLGSSKQRVADNSGQGFHESACLELFITGLTISILNIHVVVFR